MPVCILLGHLHPWSRWICIGRFRIGCETRHMKMYWLRIFAFCHNPTVHLTVPFVFPQKTQKSCSLGFFACMACLWPPTPGKWSWARSPSLSAWCPWTCSQATIRFAVGTTCARKLKRYVLTLCDVIVWYTHRGQVHSCRSKDIQILFQESILIDLRHICECFACVCLMPCRLSFRLLCNNLCDHLCLFCCDNLCCGCGF